MFGPPLQWPQLLLSLLAGYVLAVFVIVGGGTLLCALLRRGSPMDELQSRLFAARRDSLGRRALFLLRETLWQALAFVLQLAHAVRLLPVPRAPQSARPVLVLPGYWENGGVMWLLARRLAAAGYRPLLFDYPSSRHSIERNATVLAETVQRVRDSRGGEPVLVVAHSMSGLVTRSLLRRDTEHGIAALCALCSPFHGTNLASLGRRVGLRGALLDMTPESAFLRDLAADAWHEVPMLSLIGTQEDVVTPEWSAIVEGADNRVLPGPYGHVTPLFAPEVFRIVEAWLDERVRGSGSSA